ncbi:xyloside xylosyltransferase 1 [Scaptodrosophila lebanonensis]|uniref:Xyloside xylosyltransferase 1 n=1 Tax=Drosophila lebanonensis TaxID=7225 RepID=A0A6J2UJ68_DROLE|nr:xyloside xylosyltransferase 1 [Scaptodrosophila lebanonensis]
MYVVRMCIASIGAATALLFKMGKHSFNNISQKHKVFPANVNIYSTKCKSQILEEQENVTLIVNRRNSSRQKQKRWSAFRCRLHKKIVMLIILVCMCILIIFANTDLLFRRKIFSVFLSSRSNDLVDIDDQHAKNSNFEDALEEKNLPALKSSQYLLNYSSTLMDRSLQSKAFSSDYNIFVIYTKENYHLRMKFDLFTHSLLKHTTAQLHLHIITDKSSEQSVLEILQRQIKRFRRSVIYTMYDVKICSKAIQDIAAKLSPYFNSAPNSYYSDSLFFLSLGLHRIADLSLNRVILLDCDIVFRSDVRSLFAEFDHFLPHQLFGLAPELTPVYRHILYRYRVRFPKTSFGNPYYPMQLENKKEHKLAESPKHTHIRHGYPGLNSGVVLLLLNRIRDSKPYNEKLTQSEVQRLVHKYSFKGHLGDQDFFTLLGYEYPNLIYRLDCVWNRQLCTWWKDHGYSDIFDAYFRCEGVIKMYHGNCNTRIPE